MQIVEAFWKTKQIEENNKMITTTKQNSAKNPQAARTDNSSGMILAFEPFFFLFLMKAFDPLHMA